MMRKGKAVFSDAILIWFASWSNERGSILEMGQKSGSALVCFLVVVLLSILLTEKNGI